ncbi:MAG: DUF6152 family protein [Kiloniellaceae bacterium]
MITRRNVLATGGAAVLVTLTGIPGAQAHHGWRWTEDGNFELTGLIKTVQLGNPHGVLTVDADGELWTVEVGQPWRNERAGLQDALLSVGREVTISGARSADPADKKMKAERVIIDGQLYNLYPGRN